ncbi:MAG: DUF2085 domain-containing protein [Anaerolineae bacterium]|nr:DUF2085 domain-containing protein [Anaerolineae bacterium]
MTIKSTPGPAKSSPPARQVVRPGSIRAAKINRWFAKHWLLTFNAAWGLFVILPWLAPIFMQVNLPGFGKAIYFVYNFFCHQLPERSWFLFGSSFSYSQAQIAAAWGLTLSDIGDELIRRQFIGTPELGWKVAWSDRMVSMYGSIFLFGLLYALLRQRGSRVKSIPWWLFVLLLTPMAIDGITHLVSDALRLNFRQTNEWAAILTNNAFSPDFYADDRFGSLNSMLRLVTGILFGFGVVAFLWPIMDNEFSPKNR